MVSTQGLNQQPQVGILTGPTATGKSTLALELAEQAGDIEIINADSILVYRYFDIGSAKPSADEQRRTLHHLIDIRDPNEPYTAGDFVQDVLEKIEEIQKRNRRPLVVGGTGFYLKALIFGLWDNAGPADPQIRQKLEEQSNQDLYTRLAQKDSTTAQTLGLNDRYRLIRSLEIIEQTGKTLTEIKRNQKTTPDPRFQLWIIDREQEQLEKRIATRTRRMLERGLIEETQSLMQAYPHAKALQSVGYAQTRDFLLGKKPPGRKPRSGTAGLEDEIHLATKQLVKKQRKWFKSQHGKETGTLYFTLERDRDRLKEAFAKIYPSIAPGDTSNHYKL